MTEIFKIGIDIGSTTAKLVVLDQNHHEIHTDYRRHHAEIRKAFIEMLEDGMTKVGDQRVQITITGSAGMGLSEKLHIPFIQEVVASAELVKKQYPSIKTLIDIGGEDTKMIFFNESMTPDIRMNGNCAGGTGAFIDQMAALMDIDVKSLSSLAEQADHIYPIASRCGVFAKTDIQSLMSRKIAQEEIAASIFHAVAIQTINALARGMEIVPKVLFSGGPLAFIPALRTAFMNVLKQSDEDVFIPEHPELMPATGAALSENNKDFLLSELIEHAKKEDINHELFDREEPLFENEATFHQWLETRQQPVEQISLEEFAQSPRGFLGIDSGSTTTKMILTDEKGQVVLSHYSNNHGNHIKAVKAGLLEFKHQLDQQKITPTVLRSAVTGYGEDLIRSAFNLDDGVVETLAHYKAAHRFDPEVSFIMDIGGQDMKAMFINQGTIEKIELNEACSSGCGSFIETFASTLNHTVANFAQIACTAQNPCDLGTRCTVFMNSKVKQFLKEGVLVEDISAGLAYSVIKNSLYKVLKLRDNSLLGSHIVVQGGSFQNPAIHRAFEKILGQKVLSPSIPGLMGAYGSALLAREHYVSGESIFVGFENLDRAETYKTTFLRCKGCENNCMITQLKFEDKKVFYTGNKCEKYFNNKGGETKIGEDIHSFKLDLLFNRPQEATNGNPIMTIGIPRGLNIYESYPFWHTLFTGCGINVVLSDPSTMPLYEKGMGTIMSDNICFPAKLMHGHIINLVEKKVDRIFYPMVVHDANECHNSEDSYNCPVVTGYPDVIKSAINPYKKYGVPFDAPPLTFKDENLLKKACFKYLSQFGIKKRSFEQVFKAAVASQHGYKRQLLLKGQELIEKAAENEMPLIMLTGRPYHLDPQINHKIPTILTELGAYVISEDIVDNSYFSTEGIHIITQWAYPNRIFNAAKWTAKHPTAELVGMNSFGCGPDAFLTDELKDILATVDKHPTIVRIDEISSPGSIRLRLRTMVESLRMRGERRTEFIPREKTPSFQEVDNKRTILVPGLSHFYTPDAVTQVFKSLGINIEILPPTDEGSVTTGMKYANNEICYPSILVIGDIIQALQSGKYDLDKIAIGITQTGGQCRASNYIALIKKALLEAGFKHVPVIALGTAGKTINDQPGFKFNPIKLLQRAFMVILFGDAISMMHHATSVREKVKGTSRKLVDKYMAKVTPFAVKEDFKSILALTDEAIDAFNNVDIYDKSYPKVGIVGEIFIKYNEHGNHHIVDWLTNEGIEVEIPPLIDFFTHEVINLRFYRDAHIRKNDITYYLSFVFERYIDRYVKRLRKRTERFRFYHHSDSVKELSEKGSKIVNLVNQYGEGWLLSAEISEFVENGVNHVICLQPFGCIANHVIAKGVEKRMKDVYPNLNILYLDLDGDTSKVNYVNRIHFLINSAREQNDQKQKSFDIEKHLAAEQEHTGTADE